MRYLCLALLLPVCACKDSGASSKPSGTVQTADSPKSGLGTIRSALSIYYGDMDGQYPQDLAALTVGGKHLTAIPKVGPADLHPVSSDARNGIKPTDEGGWLYNNDPASVNAGNVMINCTHTDAKGSVWTGY